MAQHYPGNPDLARVEERMDPGFERLRSELGDLRESLTKTIIQAVQRRS